MKMEIVPKIDSIKIRNKGPIKKADIKFKDGLNIITGKNATGKTAVINEIAQHAEDRKELMNLSSVSPAERGAMLIAVLADLSALPRFSGKCLLVDDVLDMLDHGTKKKILETASKSKIQVIITTREPKIEAEEANIIDTSLFDSGRV